MRHKLAFALISAGLFTTASQAQDITCALAINTVEHYRTLPPRLMDAISEVESAHWPWTINADGVPYKLATKYEAMQTAYRLIKEGVGDIDVGCMQISLTQHKTAFATLDAAFDPVQNALYAANYLQILAVKHQNWHKATASFHSSTPSVGEPYASKVETIKGAYLATFAPDTLSASQAPRNKAILPPIQIPAYYTRPNTYRSLADQAADR